MKFKELVNQAREMESSAAGWYRQNSEPIRNEISKIQLDPMLSGDGRIAKKMEYQAQQAAQLIKLAHQRKQEYVKALTDARADAESVIKKGVKKPADDVVTEFEHALRYLKTELLLTNRYESAEKKLGEFISQISDPYLASKMASEFIDIVPHALSIATEQGKAKLKLAGMFERLNTEFLPPEIKEAKEAVKFVEHTLENPKIFPAIVETNANDLLGHGMGKFLNDTDSFLNLLEQTVVEDIKPGYIGKMPVISEKNEGPINKILPDSKFD